MGVASMDSFMRALLLERSSTSTTTSTATTAAQHDDNYRYEDCVTVVVDNARFHKERWSELPRRVRNHLMKFDPHSPRPAGGKPTMGSNSHRSSSSKSPLRGKPSGRKGGGSLSPVRQTSGGTAGSSTAAAHTTTDINNPRACRWISMDSSRTQRSDRIGGGANNGSSGSFESSIPAPPSYPQRQQSSEFQFQHNQQQQHHHQSHHQQKHQESSDSMPSVQEEDSSSNLCPSSPTSELNMDGFRHVAPPPQEDTPRMPERQASDPSYDFANYGIHKMPVPPLPIRSSSEEPLQLAGQTFGKVIKRTTASLLDDDDDDDDDDEIELQHPHLVLQTLQGF